MGFPTDGIGNNRFQLYVLYRKILLSQYAGNKFYVFCVHFFKINIMNRS